MPVSCSVSSRVGLPGRVLLPRLLVDRPVEAVDLVRERQVVEDQVLREAQLVRGSDGHEVVDHVRRGVALGGRVDVHPDAVLDVRPREHVLLEHAHPGAVELREGAGQPALLDVLGDLADDVRVVAIDRLLPFLVRIEEPVPVGALQHGPVLRVSAVAVGERVDPTLRQVALGIRLDVDRDVLIDRGAPLARGEVVVAAALPGRELLGAGLGVREDGLRDAAFLDLRGHGSPLSVVGGRRELVEVDVGLGHALGLQQRDRRLDHRRRAADVRVDLGDVALQAVDDVGDQAGLARPSRCCPPSTRGRSRTAGRTAPAGGRGRPRCARRSSTSPRGRCPPRTATAAARGSAPFRRRRR